MMKALTLKVRWYIFLLKPFSLSLPTKTKLAVDKKAPAGSVFRISNHVLLPTSIIIYTKEGLTVNLDYM